MNRADLRRYAAAVLLVAAALFLKLKASLLVELEGGFLILLAAVLLSAWYGGRGPGLVATALSLLFSSRYSPLPMPPQSIILQHPLPIALFLLDGVLLSLMAAGIRRQGSPARTENHPDRLLDVLLGQAAHDLRSPLNAILGWVQLGRDPAGGDSPAQGRAWEAVEQNARAQLQLIDHLLDTVAVLQGPVRLEPGSVNFALEIGAAVEALAPLAREREIRLSVKLAEDMAVLRGDRVRLRQIASELLSQAIEATPPKGGIEVRLERQGRDAVLSVGDGGAGIWPGRPRFPFWRADDSTDAGRNGRRSVGLMVTGRLVELHGGTLSVGGGGGGGGGGGSGGGGGGGARFVVRIPFGEA